jgi:hypothetical protein
MVAKTGHPLFCASLRACYAFLGRPIELNQKGRPTSQTSRTICVSRFWQPSAIWRSNRSRDGALGKYDTVLFINDVVHCPADILEVLYQHWKQKADMSCSVDWHSDPLIYDRWVIRSMTGHPYYEHDAVQKYLGPKSNRSGTTVTTPGGHKGARAVRATIANPSLQLLEWNGSDGCTCILSATKYPIQRGDQRSREAAHR